jgi:hypothetical protein
MSITFGFFHDAALTQPVASGTEADLAIAGIGSDDLQLWYGSTATATQVQATSNPGTDPIAITPTDAASGSGLANTAVKLATSQGGLAAATAGGALSIGTTLASGPAGAFPFWVRVTSAVNTAAVHTDLSLDTNDVTETAT